MKKLVVVGSACVPQKQRRHASLRFDIRRFVARYSIDCLQTMHAYTQNKTAKVRFEGAPNRR